MKILMSLLLLVTFAASNGAVQVSRQKAKPGAGRVKVADADAERVLRRFLEVVGEKKSVETVRSRVMRGLVEWSPQGITGKVDIFYKAPNKSLAVFEVPGRGQFIEAFDGKNGWLQTPFTGAVDYNNKTLDAMRRNSDGGYIKLSEVFSRLAYKGTRKLGPREAHVIEATPFEGLPEVHYYDAESGLLVQLDRVRRGLREQNVPVSVTFEDYATVDGFKIPTLIRQSYPDVKVRIRIYEVKHNTRLEDELFNRPAGARDSRSILNPE